MRAGQCEDGTELGGTEDGSESFPSVPFELVLIHDLYTPNRFLPEGEGKVWLIARLTPAANNRCQMRQGLWKQRDTNLRWLLNRLL
jgi:hypothetical protein